MGTAGEERQAKEWEEERERERKDGPPLRPYPDPQSQPEILTRWKKEGTVPGLGDLSPCEYTQPSFQKEILQS